MKLQDAFKVGINTIIYTKDKENLIYYLHLLRTLQNLLMK